MKRIDFFGVPASGKSTIYRQMVKKTSRGWLTPLEAQYDVNRPFIKKHGGLYRWKNLVCKFTPKTTALNQKVRKSIIQDSGRELVMQGEWEDFIRFMIEALQIDITHPGNRLEMTERMLYWIYETLPVVKFESQEKVCYDWSLCQRAIDREFFRITQNAGYAESYYEKMPAPDLAVRFTAPEEVIVDRIKQRFSNQVNPEHRGLSEDELLIRTRKSLNIVDVGYKILEKRGIPVITADTNQDNIDTITEKVEGAVLSI